MKGSLVERRVLNQGLESLVELSKNRDLTTAEILNQMYWMLQESCKGPAVICLDVNHNGDYGRSCTNESCFKYQG